MKIKFFVKGGVKYRVKSTFGDLINAVPLKSNGRAKMNERIVQVNEKDINVSDIPKQLFQSPKL